MKFSSSTPFLLEIKSEAILDKPCMTEAEFEFDQKVSGPK
jgi:hypothetical protein